MLRLEGSCGVLQLSPWFGPPTDRAMGHSAE